MLSIWSKPESEIEQVIGHCGSAPHYAEMLIGSELRIRFAFFQESGICCGGQRSSGQDQLEPILIIGSRLFGFSLTRCLSPTCFVLTQD